MENLRTFEVKAETVETLEKEKAIIHWISTPDIDRGKDIVNPKGMDDTDFDKSPSVWYNHNYLWDINAKPIGKSLWRKKKDDGVLAKTQFSKTYLEADDIYNLHKEGIINTWSIGFTIPEKEGALEFDDKKGITYINKWIMHEYSSAPLAMNPNALDEAKSLVKSEQFKNIIGIYEVKLNVEEQLKSFQNTLDEIQSIKKQLEELITLKSSVERLDVLEKDILDLTKILENKTQEIKIEPSVETLSYKEAKRIVAGEVSRYIKSNKEK